MTEIMRVDTAGLRGAEPAVRYLSSSAASVLARLTGVLDAAGACWGSDQTGTAFAESYLPGAQLVRDALPSLRDDMSGVAEALVLAADNVDAAEGRAQARLS
jgi:hypothetical protein